MSGASQEDTDAPLDEGSAAATLDTYYQDHPAPKPRSTDEDLTLADLQGRVRSIEAELFELHGYWYQVSLLKHGLQYSVYDFVDRDVAFEADVPDGTVRAVYNVMQSVQNQTMTYFLDSPPRYITRAITEDGEDIEKAKVGGQIAKFFENRVNLKAKRHEAANWLTTLGNSVFYCGWDPFAGGTISMPDGRQIPEGDWVAEVAPPYQFIVDPEARNMEEIKWVIRRRRISRDWVVGHFGPEKAALIQDEPYAGADLGASFETAWMTLSHRHGAGGRTETYMPQGRNVVYVYEMFEVPSPWYPEGRYVIMCQDNILHMGANPYADKQGYKLPYVFFRFINVEGGFWARTTLMDLIYIQMEINRRESQKSEHCNLLGNPPFFSWVGDGLDEDNLTNMIGQIYKLNPEIFPAQPFFPRMPDLPMTVREMVPEAMKFVDFISGNFGPSRGEVSSQVKSGVQQMMLEEADSRNMKSYMGDWESGWEQVYKLAIYSFQQFAVIPRKVKVLGDNNSWRLVYMSRGDLLEDTDIEVVPGSTLPTSRTSMFTQFLALLQAGAINLQDPSDNQRFWEALQMGDMVRIVADKKLDREKALRNLERIKQGQRAMYDPISDDPQIHIDTINSFIKTAEFEDLDESTKLLTLLYRQQVIVPLSAQLQTPTVPEGFPMFPGPDAGGSGLASPGRGPAPTGEVSANSESPQSGPPSARDEV